LGVGFQGAQQGAREYNHADIVKELTAARQAGLVDAAEIERHARQAAELLVRFKVDMALVLSSLESHLWEAANILRDLLEPCR